MKVVYNTCYGGFSLSKPAIERYLNLKGLPFIVETSKYGLPSYTVNGEHWCDRDIPRNDPALVQVVEELGKAASGAHASLAITEVKSGERWRIDEYDGSESVMTIDDYEWNIAD